MELQSGVKLAAQCVILKHALQMCWG